MTTSTVPTVVDPLIDLDPAGVPDEWTRRGLHLIDDADLFELAARRIAVPRLEPPDSFVLHAPLELLARVGLLRHVAPSVRERARQRIAWLAAAYEASGPGLAPNDLPALPASGSASELVAHLADDVLPSLAAAAHGSIFLYLLPRQLPASPAAGEMARGLVAEISRQPDWRLSWMDRRATGVAATGDLQRRLLDVPDVGDPGSNFIYPTMSLVERTGLAAELLDAPTRELSVEDARRDLLRVAAWSMLQDDPEHAPYGWTHAMTMAQATLGMAQSCADPGRAIAVAATYVLGFRSTLGKIVLDPAWEPARRPDLTPATFLNAGPEAAAAAMWWASDAERPIYLRRLASLGALHVDAHLAKYTLACIDATRDDPAAGTLYLAAAASLAGWWMEHGQDDDLLARTNS